MNDLSDPAVIAALRRQMTLAVAKQTVAASNLANLDTPGYRARELDFSHALDRQLATPLAATEPGHLQTSVAGSPQTREVSGVQARRDGNTVQLDRELLTMTQASGEFAAAQTVLAAKFRLLRYAINEGR